MSDHRRRWRQTRRLAVGQDLSEGPEDPAPAIEEDLGYDDWDLESEEEEDAEDERLRREAKWDEIRERWNKKHKPGVDDFGRFLESYPYLGLHHRVGQLIHENISRFESSHVTRRVWWRARKAQGAKSLSTRDLQPPPPIAANAEGRFNHFGQSHFYLASSPEGALFECLDRKNHETVAWVQEFKVTEVKGILDLTVDPYMRTGSGRPVLLVGLIHEHLPKLVPDRHSAWKPEYFVSRFVADCAKRCGFTGMFYQGRNPDQENLVLFRWTLKQVQPVGHPNLEVLSGRRSSRNRPSKGRPSNSFGGSGVRGSCPVGRITRRCTRRRRVNVAMNGNIDTRRRG